MLRWFTRLVLLLFVAIFAPGETSARTQTRVWPPEVQSEKLASGFFGPEASILRQSAAMQAAKLQQESSGQGYHFASGCFLRAESAGIRLTVKEPRILSRADLSSDELAYLQKQFAVKRNAISRAASRGELKWSPGTGDVRIGDLQRQYREAVAARFQRRYGRNLALDALNADHSIDLLIGGSATQRLKLIDESLNKSIGASLLQAGRKAGLSLGDIINEVNFIGRP